MSLSPQSVLDLLVYSTLHGGGRLTPYVHGTMVTGGTMLYHSTVVSSRLGWVRLGLSPWPGSCVPSADGNSMTSHRRACNLSSSARQSSAKPYIWVPHRESDDKSRGPPTRGFPCSDKGGMACVICSKTSPIETLALLKAHLAQRGGSEKQVWALDMTWSKAEGLLCGRSASKVMSACVLRFELIVRSAKGVSVPLC